MKSVIRALSSVLMLCAAISNCNAQSNCRMPFEESFVHLKKNGEGIGNVCRVSNSERVIVAKCYVAYDVGGVYESPEAPSTVLVYDFDKEGRLVMIRSFSDETYEDLTGYNEYTYKSGVHSTITEQVGTGQTRQLSYPTIWENYVYPTNSSEFRTGAAIGVELLDDGRVSGKICKTGNNNYVLIGQNSEYAEWERLVDISVYHFDNKHNVKISLETEDVEREWGYTCFDGWTIQSFEMSSDGFIVYAGDFTHVEPGVRSAVCYLGNGRIYIEYYVVQVW